VLWIGYLQWHLRTQSGFPSEPILKAFHNIVVKDAVLEAKVTLVRDKSGRPVTQIGTDGKPTELYRYDEPRQPEWPEAEFIVGNPPFVAGQNLREEFGDSYAEALWTAYPDISGGSDFVMFWWDHAADLLTKSATVAKRFGLVTTNSITQEFSGRVVAKHLKRKEPISLTMTIPNHP
jgi:hypothetical protein